MKKILSCILLATTFCNLLAQKTINDPNAEKRNVSGFHGIDVATGIKLIITEGSSEEVVVSASKIEYRDKIITEVENGILKIYYKSKFGAINRKSESKRLRAYVSYKQLDKLGAGTGASIEMDGVLTCATLDLHGDTGGTVQGEINIGQLKINQNTGSKITLTGKVDDLEIEGNTGSKLMGEKLATTTCTAHVNTGARVFISVQKELSARATTGGNIKYRGEGGIRDIKTTTGGSISRI